MWSWSSKHHDGFLMWPSRHPNPHIEEWQASRDVVGELSRAANTAGLRMGFYYSSLLDWSFTRKPITSVADLIAGSDASHQYADYVESHWLELIERYDPWILWSDIGYPPATTYPSFGRTSTTISLKGWSTIAGCSSPGSSSAGLGGRS